MTLKEAVDKFIESIRGIPPEKLEESAEEVDLSGEIAVLQEAAGSSNARILVMKAGQGDSAYYTKEVIQRDLPLIFPPGTKMFWDHQTKMEESAQPEGSLRRFAGVLKTAPQWDDNGPSGPGAYSDAEVFKPFSESLGQMAPHIGVSIRARGIARPGSVGGRDTRIVEKFISGKSVDFVTTPGAGGRIVEMFESLRNGVVPDSGPPSRTKEENGMKKVEIDETELQNLREAAAKTDTLTVKLSEAESKISLNESRQREAIIRSSAVTHATDFVKGLDLSEATKKRVVDMVTVNPPSKDGILDVVAFTPLIEAQVKEERTYLASLGFTGKIKNGGRQEEKADLDVTEAEKSLASSFKGIFGFEEAAK